MNLYYYDINWDCDGENVRHGLVKASTHLDAQAQAIEHFADEGEPGDWDGSYHIHTYQANMDDGGIVGVRALGGDYVELRFEIDHRAYALSGEPMSEPHQVSEPLTPYEFFREFQRATASEWMLKATRLPRNVV